SASAATAPRHIASNVTGCQRGTCKYSLVRRLGGESQPPAHWVDHIRRPAHQVCPGVLEDAVAEVLELVASLCVTRAVDRVRVAEASAHLDDDSQVLPAEVDTGDV